ncbi:MAG: VWA domain-containing protein [Lentisphaeria bacterium]|nr:VWA domain-containing protein [Lentisphaeria bacterium]
MKFNAADWLYLLIIPVLVMPVIAAVSNARKKKLLAALLGKNADSPESVHLSAGARLWRRIILGSAIVLLIAAAARPSFYSRLLPFEPKGRDIMVLCDVSRSMNAADIAPSRLKHAQYILRQLSSAERGDRFGLVPFAGNAFLSCPLTSDPVTFNEYVDELSSDSIPVGGTNLEKALRVAEKAFAASEGNSRAVILLTDGEELQGNSSAMIAELKKKRLPLFIIGFGDPVNGSVIPKGGNESGFIRDRNGKMVTSKLNEKMLSKLAAATGGLYFRTSATDTGVRQLEDAINNLDRSARKNVKQQIPVEEFPKLLAAALVLIIIFLLISERKSAAVLFMCAAGAFCIGAAENSGETVKAAAKPAIVIPEDAAGLYNTARKLQLSGNPEYTGLYEKLLADPRISPELRAMAFHNLGAGIHHNCRKQFAQAQQQLQQQQLDRSLQLLAEAEQSAAGSEELYSRSAVGAAAIPEFGSNLTRLAHDRKRIEELKKKIEELKKQQQKAQNQTRQAQKQNKNTPQDRSQRQQQQNSIEQARKEAEKMQKQASELNQSQMADSAGKAAEEVKKAAAEKAANEDRKSQQHIENAMKELKKHDLGNQKKPQPGKDKKDSGKTPEKQPSPASGREMKKDKPPQSSEQLLELMGEDDKKLREAIKQRNRMRRSQVEKDW